MTYKTIVTIIPDAQTGTRVLDTAILVASKNDSHIIAVHAEPSAAAYATRSASPMPASSRQTSRKAANAHGN